MMNVTNPWFATNAIPDFIHLDLHFSGGDRCSRSGRQGFPGPVFFDSTLITLKSNFMQDHRSPTEARGRHAHLIHSVPLVFHPRSHSATLETRKRIPMYVHAHAVALWDAARRTCLPMRSLVSACPRTPRAWFGVRGETSWRSDGWMRTTFV